MELLDDVIRRLRAMHQPVVAAVNGPAIGGGFCLALAGDIRLSAPSAFFRGPASTPPASMRTWTTRTWPSYMSG
jgi:enoyl-CoA hydratase/carnithine racemase